jgi:ketosteroid isomerase-like protein
MMKSWVYMLPLILISGCQSKTGNDISLEERKAIVKEVTRTAEQYVEAVMGGDLKGMLAFWSDSEDFVFAGDGVIIGGYDELSALLTRSHEETERWLKWESYNVNVAVLSRDAASYTYEFEYAKIKKDGSTLNTRGSWTSVFRKREGVWKVVHANGTHLQL